MKDEGLRIKLRAVEPEDADFMYEVESDPAAWKYSDYVAPLSRELLRQYALTYDADPLRSGQIRFIAEGSGKPIGIVDLFDISARHLRADTGIYIATEYRDDGVGVTALNLLKQYSKERLGLHQLNASVSKLNEGALRCYKKAGFIETGTRPEWWRTDDGYEDVVLLMFNLEL